jgi:alanyl-tRNA synthetase
MTERLYYQDSNLLQFSARVLEADASGTRVVLDRTAFYPSSGGQPNDLGTLSGVAVLDVQDEERGIVHVLEAPLVGGADGQVEGLVDRARRFDHMQQHSGQHLLSAVFEEVLGYPTVSFHLGAESSTIDVRCAALETAQVRRVEARANELVQANRPLRVDFEDAAQARGLRKETAREGTLRVVTIDGVDRSACGGTHVGHTGEIGAILIRRIEKIRGDQRVEFVCGARAVARAQADYSALSKIARNFSSALDATPELVASLLEQVREAEKIRRKLALELAGLRGRDWYAQTGPDGQGLRRYHLVLASGTPDEETRALAQSYCAQPRALFVASSNEPPNVMLAASADSGIHAGNVLKQALAASGGRGGGNAAVAQGSLPSVAQLESVLAALAHL